MLRTTIALIAGVVLSGCSHFQHQTADCPCEDCLPPNIAGKYKFHRCIDDIVTGHTARKCAMRDLKQMNQECSPVSPDFAEGYRQAYIDLAYGRPACVPAVPPKKYWHAWHRSCAGHEGVEQWYAGYRHGLDNGVNGGVNHFNRIVPNAEGCCVSAAYISPYASPLPPNGVIRPLGGQTVSQYAPVDSAEAGLDPNIPNAASGPISPVGMSHDRMPLGPGYEE